MLLLAAPSGGNEYMWLAVNTWTGPRIRAQLASDPQYRMDLRAGQTVVTEKSDITITQQPGALVQMAAGAKLADVVKALNSLGATPQDLLAILQALKAAGALSAELEVI